MPAAIVLTLMLDVLWFGVAFWFFGLVPARAAALLVKRGERGLPMFRTLAASVRFLGGMNLALALFAALLVATRPLFPDPRQSALFFGVFAVAHATQFAFNLPVLARRSDSAMWPVTRGWMSFIFVVDGLHTILNAGLAFALLGSPAG